MRSTSGVDESADATCIMIIAVLLLERDMSDNMVACDVGKLHCVYNRVKSM